MKILYNARTAKNWKRVCDCKDCGSKLKINARDLRPAPFDQRDGAAYIFTCPVCKTENWIAADLVPRGVVT